MTWKEIEPIAEAILGENCGKLTLEGLYSAANRMGIKTMSDLVKLLESAALSYEWLREEGLGREEEYLYELKVLTNYATRLNASNALKQ